MNILSLAKMKLILTVSY